MKIAWWGAVGLIALIAAGPRAQTRQLQWHIDVNDPQHLLAPDTEAVTTNCDAALRDWSRHIYGRAPLNVEIEVVTRQGRFGGRSRLGVGVQQGAQVCIEEGAANRLRTGRLPDSAGPDVIIEVQPDFMRKAYWIDPHPYARTDPVPVGKVDLVTVFAHELGHAFGMNGRLNRLTGEPQGDRISLFDSHIVDATGGSPLFRGAATNRVYGGDLPLTFISGPARTILIAWEGRQIRAGVSPSQNFYHYGWYTSPGDKAAGLFGLMGGAWPYPHPGQGLRIPVGDLDTAILEDLGVPTL